MALYSPPEALEGVRRATGDIAILTPPRVTIETKPVEASLRLRGVENETRDYAPRVGRGEVVATVQGDRLTVVEIVSDPFEGLVLTETVAINIGAGVVVPVAEPQPAPIEQPPLAPPPPPAEEPPPPTPPAPVSEEQPTTAVSATESGAVETLPFTTAQQAYIEEMVQASGCQTEEEFEFAPDGTFLGSRLFHNDGSGRWLVGYTPLY